MTEGHSAGLATSFSASALSLLRYIPFLCPLPHFTIKQIPTPSSISGPSVPSSRKPSLTSLGRTVSSHRCAPKALRSYDCWTAMICLHVPLPHRTVSASTARTCLMHFHVWHLFFFLTCSLGTCFLKE